MNFVEKGRIKYNRVEFLVFDKADRMLYMGFKEDAIRNIIMHRTMPRRGERKTLMFSATFPDEIQSMAHDYLSDEIFLRVGVVSENN